MLGMQKLGYSNVRFKWDCLTTLGLFCQYEEGNSINGTLASLLMYSISCFKTFNLLEIVGRCTLCV